MTLTNQSELTQDKINTLISKVNNYTACDTTCRRNKDLQALKEKLSEAKNNLKNAPTAVETAEKNYYVFSEGEKGYEDRMLQRYTKTADLRKQKALTKHRELVKDITTMISDYNAETLYTQRMNELLEIKIKKNKNLKKQVDNNLSTTLTNDRRVTYEDKQLNGLHSMRKTMKYIYYSILVIYLIFGNFFKNSLYKKPIVWLYIILYIAFPFIINLISEFVFNLFHKIKYLLNNKAPKNVYTNL